MKEIGCVGMTTYNCRHTFVTLAVNAGVSQSQLMEIVGHVDAQTTKKYTHMDAAALVSAVSGIGKSLTVVSKLSARSAHSNHTAQNCSQNAEKHPET